MSRSNNWALRIGLVCILAAMTTARTAHAACRSRTVSPTAGGECKLSDPARECQSCGKPLFWPTRCAGFTVDSRSVRNLSGDVVREVARRAFDRWSRVECRDGTSHGGPPSIEGRDMGMVDCREGFHADRPSHNVILFQDTAWPYAPKTAGGIEQDTDTLALTTLLFDSTGRIHGGTLEMNTAQHQFSLSPKNDDEYDLERVLTHEIGHFLGLAHSDKPDAVMYWAARPGPASAELSDDDRAAICEAYPPDGSRTVDRSVSPTGQVLALPCNPVPKHGFTRTCAEAETSLSCGMTSGVTGESTSIAALAAAAGLLASRRRRRV